MHQFWSQDLRRPEINAGDGGNGGIIRESSASLVGCQSKQLESEEHPLIMMMMLMMMMLMMMMMTMMVMMMMMMMIADDESFD